MEEGILLIPPQLKIFPKIEMGQPLFPHSPISGPEVEVNIYEKRGFLLYLEKKRQSFWKFSFLLIGSPQIIESQ